MSKVSQNHPWKRRINKQVKNKKPAAPSLFKPYAVCKECGWIHFVVSKKAATAEVRKFNEYYDSLSPDDQENYYGGKKASLAAYKRCFFCGTSHKNTRELRPLDHLPTGSTVQSIMDRNE
jgi:ribosomal protein S14